MLTIKEALMIIREKIFYVILLILIFTEIFFKVQFINYKPMYEASTKLFIGKDISDQGDSKYQVGDIQMYNMLAETYVGMLESEDLVQRALDEIGLDLNCNDVLNSMKVDHENEKQYLTITLKADEPNEAKVLLDGITDELISTSKKYITNGSVYVLTSSKVPEHAVPSQKSKKLLISFAIAVMSSFTIVLIFDYLDDRVKKVDDLEKHLNTVVLGVVPKISNDMIEDNKWLIGDIYDIRK